MGLSSKEVSSVQHEPLKCPRCDSTNTKFCYYNNYNKSQPRHFCKACKRHWTKGGTLRNVPVGGGRKNKRKASKAATPKTPYQEQPRLSQLPLGTLGGVDEKNLSEAFYQTLGRHPLCSMPESSINLRNKTINDENNGIFLGCFEQELNFPYSNLGTFSNSSSIQTPNLYNFTEEHETVMNTLNPNQQEPISWSIANNNSSNLMGISSNWGWDDFEKFVSVDEAELTIPWDDADNIKP